MNGIFWTWTISKFNNNNNCYFLVDLWFIFSVSSKDRVCPKVNRHRWFLVFKQSKYITERPLKFTHGLNHCVSILTVSWRRPLSYRNQSIDLQSKSIYQWTGFYMITASVMKRLRILVKFFKMNFACIHFCEWPFLNTFECVNFCEIPTRKFLTT